MIEKPTPPGPRLIREDFLPNEPMKNYRIKKVVENGGIPLYYIQKKVLWIWWIDTNLNGFDWFLELEHAKKAIRDNIKITVEYICDLN